MKAVVDWNYAAPFLSECVCIHSYAPHKGNEFTDLNYMNEYIKYIRSDQSIQVIQDVIHPQVMTGPKLSSPVLMTVLVTIHNSCELEFHQADEVNPEM